MILILYWVSAESSCVIFISEKCSLSFSSSHFCHCPAPSKIVHLSFQDIFSKILKLQFMSALKPLIGKYKKVESVSKCNKLYKFWFSLYGFLSSPDSHVKIHRSSETLRLEWIQIAMLTQCAACEVPSSDIFVCTAKLYSSQYQRLQGYQYHMEMIFPGEEEEGNIRITFWL